MTLLLRPVTKMKCSMPAWRASSTTCWMSGRSTTGNISLGMALVAGRKRVPRPATGNMALRIGFMLGWGLEGGSFLVSIKDGATIYNQWRDKASRHVAIPAIHARRGGGDWRRHRGP